MTCCGGLSGLDILQQVAQGSNPQQNSVLLHLMLPVLRFQDGVFLQRSYEKTFTFTFCEHSIIVLD